jgi:hypothetical protein
MDSLEKIQKIGQILCDAENDVWLYVSKLLHTHSQVTGMKIDCCTVNSSFVTKGEGTGSVGAAKNDVEQKPKISSHIWIPIKQFPKLKDTGHNPVSKKLIHHALVKYKKYAGSPELEGTIKKCNKLFAVVVALDNDVEKHIPYTSITHVSSSILQHLPVGGENYAMVKKIAEEIKKSVSE